MDAAGSRRTNGLRRGRDRPQGPIASAAVVVLATLGCTPAGPRPEAADGYRKAMDIASPFEGAISWLQSCDGKGPRIILVHWTPGSA